MPLLRAGFHSKTQNPKSKITMSHWQKIRDAAESLRQEICAASNLDHNKLFSAQDFLNQAAEYLELDLIPEHPESGNLSGALAVLEDDCIHFNNHLKNWYKSFCIAHEIGHFRLHHKSVHCTREEIQDFDGETNSATEKIVGYGAGDRREREANLFALEFLLPCANLRGMFLKQNLNSKKLAEIAGMSPEVVAGQLARALLVPNAESKKISTLNEKNELNDSQKRAAETVKCPTLVYAGPGTGKTQTLTHRIAHLIEQGIEPKRILALTFSNKAAEEMRERIGKINETVAAQIQVMTFHAYGLEILRAYWVEAQLKPRSNLLDKIDALLYLEKNLNVLELNHYQNLHEPTQNLAAILGAISRAKDELCAPDEYRILGEQMLSEAVANDDDELKLKAEKVIETANVYQFYEKYLQAEKLLDFGDLVYRAVKLLQENDAVRKEVCAKYDAVLVDEFQDVNRACGVLLKEIAGCGKGLWAVGDLRQSIYRWRGASPANIELFEVDFPNAETISLEKNYRSRTEIVELFANFARQMKTAGDNSFNSWESNRGAAKVEKLTAIRLEISETLDCEAANLATNINLYHENGLQFKDCAIICRTHAQLNKFAKVLSEKGIPIFYLGEIFERDEVRDLLALLDLKVSAGGHSLIRVANFPEYKIPLADSRKIIAAQKENKQTFVEVVENAEFTAQLSSVGKIGIKKLLHQLLSPKEVSAWSFLSNYLFAESEYLNAYFVSNDIHNQSKRLAIYQFLRLAQNLEDRFSGGENLPIQELLIYIKKLAHFNEDKNYAQIPAEAENLDAVRLLTVHSAKGLEFSAVFLPYLGSGKIPSNAKPQICPNPEGMMSGNEKFHESEEECLFFVAMSRSRDFLHLSRAGRYGESNSKESKFLTALAEYLPPAELIKPFDTEIDELIAETDEIFNPQVYYSADLDRYLRCGRDYFYTKILGLKETGDKSIYLKFHACIYDTLTSMQSIKQLENVNLTEEIAIGRLHEFWTAAEINKHPYSPIYLERAEEIIRRVSRKLENADVKNEITRPTYDVKLSNGVIRVRLDAVEIIRNGAEKIAVIRKYKTGKSPKKPATDDVDVLMKVAVQNYFPETTPVLQKIYLSDDIVQKIPISAKVIENRLKIYEKAIEDIRRKKFEPSPADNCPHCPHYFICPSGE